MLRTFSFFSKGSEIFLEENFFLSEGSVRCCAPFLFLFDGSEISSEDNYLL